MEEKEVSQLLKKEVACNTEQVELVKTPLTPFFLYLL